MTDYTVEVKVSTRKELEWLSGSLLARLVNKMEGLFANPRSAGCKKLKEFKDQWRIRVGDYRILYIIDDADRCISITRIQHRKDVYGP